LVVGKEVAVDPDTAQVAAADDVIITDTTGFRWAPDTGASARITRRVRDEVLALIERVEELTRKIREQESLIERLRASVRRRDRRD
jgi:hypothetical protein